jgi:hypothetical protein
MSRPKLLSRAGFALAGALLLGSGSGWSQSIPSSRPAKGQLLLDALVRLTPTQRSAYIQAQRTLEVNRSRQRLDQLAQAQRCLAQASMAPAITRCMEALSQSGRQLRVQQMQQQQALAKRYGLPLPQGAGRHGRWGDS